MIFHPLAVGGAWSIEPESDADHRGYFTRAYCRHRLESRGLDPAVVRNDVVVCHRRGHLYGLRYRAFPPGEVTLMRAIRGAVWAAVLDLRPTSPTYRQHLGLELSLDNRRALYLPAGVAHGFLTLENECEVFLQMSELASPADECGVRWDDPAFAIPWPFAPVEIAERDRRLPDFPTDC
ncbi:MAG: dTDP-4-keto-6-deoxy-D-glucose epimerase [Acidobacteria bacterium]|nr:MAG: dTDP-4-keto-6-deoxy-D-glucose epimerase [Acidobacteriota bacterium]